MATRVPPTLRLAVLCEDVVYDENGQPYALQVPVHTIAIPPDADGRFRPPTLWLYLQLSDGVGMFFIRAEVRNESGTIQYQTRPPIEVVFDGITHRAVPIEVALELSGLEFPGAGLYEVLVLANHLSLHDPRSAIPVPYPPIRVSVLPAVGPAGGGG